MPDTMLFQGGADAPVRLRMGRCSRCAHAFFPMQRLGCERCGTNGDALGEELVLADGTVIAAIVVHRHRAPGVEAPFQLASVRLDAGPVVRGLLAPHAGRTPQAGARVTGAVADGPDSPVPAFRFAVESEERA